MKKERFVEIKEEAIKRLKLWLKNSSFEEMSANGIQMRFNMSLGLFGIQEHIKKDWMAEGDWDRFIEDEEFFTKELDHILCDLFSSTKYNEPFMI
jgi:hypothetical protein